MVYKNKKGQSRERAMVAAYSLFNHFGGKQKDIAKVLDCSNSTVHQWIKEIDYKKQIEGLNEDLNNARHYIEELAGTLGLEYQCDLCGTHDDNNHRIISCLDCCGTGVILYENNVEVICDLCHGNKEIECPNK